MNVVVNAEVEMEVDQNRLTKKRVPSGSPLASSGMRMSVSLEPDPGLVWMSKKKTRKTVNLTKDLNCLFWNYKPLLKNYTVMM